MNIHIPDIIDFSRKDAARRYGALVRELARRSNQIITEAPKETPEFNPQEPGTEVIQVAKIGIRLDWRQLKDAYSGIEQEMRDEVRRKAAKVRGTRMLVKYDTNIPFPDRFDLIYEVVIHPLPPMDFMI